MRHAELVDVHHEFLVAGGETALEPAGRMQHEIGAGKDRRVQRVGAFVGRLRIRNLGGAQRAAGAERQAEPPRELRCAVRDQ